MNTRIGSIALHLALMVGIITLMVACIAYPFLPGEYDRLALPLSTMAQASAMTGLLLVPVGFLWPVYEGWKGWRVRHNRPLQARRFYCAAAALIAASVVVLVAAAVGFASAGAALGLLTLLAWLLGVSRLLPLLRAMRRAEHERFHPAPLYLVLVPPAVLLAQFLLAAPLTEFSRYHAIAASAELIGDIEAYRVRNGRYPASLLAVWKDYAPAVVGIEAYHYVMQGDAYNLFFEQPRFLFDDVGTRDFVVYNPLDQQTMISHASWILILSPSLLRGRQGWFAVHTTPQPHWKYFWFD